MDKKCNNCIEDNIGCDVIKQLRKDVLKIKVNRSCLHIIALLICSLGFIVAGLFAFRTFVPTPIAKSMVYNIKISGEKNIPGEISAEIKKELAEALVEVENRAVTAYNEKFTILLTILTIFGIAWPLVVAILQLRFNEGELKKIKEAEEKARAANELAKNMEKSMDTLESRMNIVFTEQLNAQNAIKELEKIKHDFHEDASLMYGGLATTFIVFSKQNSTTKSIFIPAVVAMYFRQLKYLCKTDTNIDDEIKSIIDTFNNNITLFESSESKELLVEAWENLDKNLLKSKCTAEQYLALEKICNVKNQNKSGESK